MNKKFYFGMFAAATMLLGTSCSSDDLFNEASSAEMVNATFTIETPEGIGTRTAGDGETVDEVACAIYDAAGNELQDLRKYEPISGKTATYNVRLAKGQSYRAAFFAYKKDANAYDVSNLKDIVVNDAKSNLESRDAFTAFVNIEADETQNSLTKTVELYRPFAQLNLGSTTEDTKAAAKAGIVVTKTSVKVTNVYKNFSAYANEVAEGAQTHDVEFALNDIMNEDLIVEGEDYTYLALNYLLVGDIDEKALTDVTFTWVADGNGRTNTREYANVPVQRNYRTNIVGHLLTSPAEVNIIVKEGFEDPDYIVSEPWDGTTTKQPVSSATEWTVSTPEEWVWLKANGVQGKNIKLAGDIDFGGHEVKGLAFEGEFDGQGHTMSNMTLLCGGSYYSNGLFQGDASGSATIKNVTIENVTAECANPEQGYVGTIFGDVQSRKTVTLSGVNVKNAKLCGVQSVGGLVGFVASGATLNVDNCTVDGSALSNYAVANESGYVAGLVGRPVTGSTVNITNPTVTNSTINAYYAPRRGEASIQPVVGDNATLTAGSDVVVTKTSLENVVFVQNAEELKTVTLEDGAIVALPEGNFDIPSSAAGKTVTFTGSGDAKKTVVNPHGAFHDAILAFENVTVSVASNASYTGSQHIAGATYKNCIIEGQIFLYGPSTFENCTFNNTGDNYNVWTYGTSSTFTGCTFNCDAKAVLIYTEGAVTAEYTFDKCIFNDSGKRNELKAAIEIGESAYGNEANYTVRINNCKVNGFSKTGKNGAVLPGDECGTEVWGNKNSIPADRLHIWIDGTEVY